MWESQHAADHVSVFDGPPQVTDLCPTIFVFHLHHALRDGQLLPGHGDHGPESHLLDLVLIDLSLFRENQGPFVVFNVNTQVNLPDTTLIKEKPEFHHQYVVKY